MFIGLRHFMLVKFLKTLHYKNSSLKKTITSNSFSGDEQLNTDERTGINMSSSSDCIYIVCFRSWGRHNDLFESSRI